MIGERGDHDRRQVDAPPLAVLGLGKLSEALRDARPITFETQPFRQPHAGVEQRYDEDCEFDIVALRGLE